MLLLLPAWHGQQGLYNGTVSIRLSVCLSHSLAALRCWRAEDIESIDCPMLSSSPPQHGAQQQMRAVPRCQLT